jgi:YbbR domain-containing protein
MLERLLSDWPVKLLSLGLAFGLWVSITGEKRIPVNFDIALDPQLRDDHVLATNPPTQVTVRLVGPESVIRKLNPLEMAVRLDLTGWPPGARELQLTEAYLVGKPPRAEVEFFDPERVQLVVDERQRRALNVTLKFTGDLPEGYTMYDAWVRPDKVIVEGPAAEVSTLTHVETDPVQLNDRSRPFLEQVSAVPDRPHVRIVDAQPLWVQVEVDASPVEKEFGEIPVQLAPRVDGANLTPDSASVTLAGPPELLARIEPQQIRVATDVSRLDASSGPQFVPLAATVDAPADQQARISVKAITPHQVTVRWSKRSESR